MSRFAVVSDTHDDAAMIDRLVASLGERGLTTVLHCGDICSPSTVDRLAPFEVHWVFGNCDWDRASLERAMDSAGHTAHGRSASVELGGLRFGFCHGDDPESMRALVENGAHDAVFHGHTHEARRARSGTTQILNPGAIHRGYPASFLEFDTVAAAAAWINITAS